ncbi:MAG: Maf family nucleotide pyrophosphatase [Muribaculaceae bacterium]
MQVSMNPLSNLSKYEVLLASNSPRRKQLLADLGIEFATCAITDIDESYPADTPVEDVALVVANVKADAYRSLITSNQLIITADTVVICGNDVLGKPLDRDEAVKMLRRLSGATHKVVTGVTISSADRRVAFKAVTEVDFAELSDDEIGFYVDTFRPLDKAGAYGIQEWIGCAGIRGIRGSFYNVMGLPLHRLYTELRLF